MLNDFVLNLAVSVIWSSIFVYVGMYFFYKKFQIKVEKYSTSIILKYHYGFHKSEARLIVSVDTLKPVLTKGFKGFNFVIPLKISYSEAIKWLQEVEVDKMYADEGKDSLELLRAVLLGYATADIS